MPPDAAWPGGAKIAVSIVLNYEEGGENNLLHGDAGSEAFLSDIAGAAPWPGQRHWNMESIYDYGARAGFWRLHRLFTGRQVPVTVYGVATALARNPEQVAAMRDPSLRAALLTEDFAPGHPFNELARNWRWLFPLDDPPNYAPPAATSMAGQAAARRLSQPA